MGWLDGETELWKHYTQLHADHLALRVVTMAMLSMLPQEVRYEIIARVSPVVDRGESSETSNFTRAVDELLDELRGIPPSQSNDADEDWSHIL